MRVLQGRDASVRTGRPSRLGRIIFRAVQDKLEFGMHVTV